MALDRNIKTLNYTEKQPCRGLEKVLFESRDIELEIDDYDTPTVTFRFNFHDFSYREVDYVQSMDGQTLIGNTTFSSILQYQINCK